MDKLYVHPRITERHPEITKQDVVDAWDSCIRYVPRVNRDGLEYIAVGVDSKGRLLELIAREVGGEWLVYHAFTPPTKKALRELGMLKG